jgi:hypothetical protein
MLKKILFVTVLSLCSRLQFAAPQLSLLKRPKVRGPARASEFCA